MSHPLPYSGGRQNQMNAYPTIKMAAQLNRIAGPHFFAFSGEKYFKIIKTANAIGKLATKNVAGRDTSFS